MTAKELIEVLEKMDCDKEVFIFDVYMLEECEISEVNENHSSITIR